MNAGTDNNTKGDYEGMYNGHCYLIEHDRLAGNDSQSLVQRIEQEDTAQHTWDFVHGHDGCIVHTRYGLLMVNGKGEYAADCGSNLVSVTAHEVQQARAKHELKEFIV